MIASVRSALLAVLVVGCSSSPAARSAAPEPPNKCAHAADHLLSLLTDTAKAAPTEELDRIRAQFKLRCEQDGWSASAQECFLGLPSKAEVDRCASLLTEAQRQALERPPPAAR